MDDVNEMARIERREYYRRWRANNPDKVKKHNENYWKKVAERKLKEEKRKNDRSKRNDP